MASAPLVACDVFDAATTRAAVTALSTAQELAVDVEADSLHAFAARLCFVQVATNDGIWLFDTLSPDVQVLALAQPLKDAQKTKYFHAAQGDLQYLAEAGLRVSGLFDTHRAATLLGWPKVGLADLVLVRHQVVLDKGHQQADFSERPLPEALRNYIADDVRYLCDVGRWVKEACQQADILEEVELDCQRLCEEASVRPDINAMVPKIPKGSLSEPMQLLASAIGEQLHRKRLEWAEKANFPMGRMLSNAALVAIATKAPTTEKELAHAQGVRSAFVREHGDEVLALVRQLIEDMRHGRLGGAQTVRPRRDSREKKRDDALRAWRAEKAAERRVTPSVVLSNPLVEALAAKPPLQLEDLAEIPWFGQKRIALYGEALVKLLSAMS